MNIKNETNKRAESLFVLMENLLEKPLTPINESIENLSKSCLDTSNKINAIQDSINSNANRLESDLKKLNRYITSIEENITSLEEKILPEQIKKLKEDIFAQITDKSNENTKYLNEVSEILQKKISIVTIDQINLVQSIKTLEVFIENINIAFSKQIDKNQTTNEKNITVLSNKLETSNRNSFEKIQNIFDSQTKLKQSIIQTNDYLKNNESILVDLVKTIEHAQQISSKTIEENKITLVHLLAQQKIEFLAQITANQSKIKNLTITTGIFFASMLSYIGYDIWSNFH